MHTPIYIHIPIYIYTHIYIYMCVCVYIYIHVFKCIYTYIHVSIYLYLSIYLSIFMYLSVYLSVHIIYIYIRSILAPEGERQLGFRVTHTAQVYLVVLKFDDFDSLSQPTPRPRCWVNPSSCLFLGLRRERAKGAPGHGQRAGTARPATGTREMRMKKKCL